MQVGMGGRTRASWALGLALSVLVVLAAPTVATATPATKTIGAGAKVINVEGKGKTLRVHVNRGSATGLKMGSKGALYPMHVAPGASQATVDFDIRVATGRVVQIQKDTAVLSIASAVAEVAVGSFFEYQMTLATTLAESPLIRITALGVGLTTQREKRPFVSLEDLLINPSQAKRDAVVDAMVVDIKSIRPLLATSMAERVADGRYHGMSPTEIVDGLDRAQVREFLLFVEAFPGKYIFHQWALPEVFMTWVINAAPSGNRDRLLRQMAPRIAAAKNAMSNDKFFVAKKIWSEILQTIPDHELAKRNIASIDKVELLRRQLKFDPDDTSTRFTVINELFELGAYQEGLRQCDELKRRNYDATTTEKYRGYFLVRLERWREAKATFRRLASANPKNENIQHWNRYTKAMAAVATSPGNPSAHFQLALVKEETKSWGDALRQYRFALESKRITKQQKQLAINAQKRIALEQSIAQQLRWAREAIEQHKTEKARKRISGALLLVDELKLLGTVDQTSRVGDILEELGDLAMSAENADLAIDLYRQRKARRPKAIESYSSLAYGLQVFDRLDEAESVMQEGLKLSGDKDYPYLILSNIARARGDLNAVEQFAQKALKNSTKYPWPRINMARVEAAANRWSQAKRYAEEALELGRDSWQIRDTYTAVLRGEDAHEGLQANPNSARDRLRLIRALAELGLANRVAREIALLPKSGTWKQEAWWALATSDDARLPLATKLNAARTAKPTTPFRKRRLEQLEAQETLRRTPSDVKTRLALARLYIEAEYFDKALATAYPLSTQAPSQAVENVLHAAREGLAMNKDIELAKGASLRGDWDSAFKLGTKIQNVANRIGSVDSRVRAQGMRGDALVALGRHSEAIQLAKESQKLLIPDGNVTGLDIANRRQATYESNIGTRESLHKALQESLALCTSLDDEECLYFVHRQLSDIEGSAGRTARGIEHGRHAWKMAERLGNLEYARAARFALANANLGANRFGDAKRIAESLLKDSRKHSDIANEQFSLMVLGEVEAMHGNGEAARKYFQEVYDLGTRNGRNDWRALARHFQGAAWLRADQSPAKAVEMLEHSAKLYKTLGEGWAVSDTTRVLRDLADAQLQAGKTSGARTTALESLKLAKRFQRVPELASAEWILAMISVEEGNAEEALAHANRSVGYAKKTDSLDLLWRTYHSQALALQLKGKREDALVAYERALDHVQRALEATGGASEQAGYMNVGRVRKLYKDTIKLLLAMKRTSRAMEVLELSRDAQLRQILDPANIETDDSVLKTKLANYKRTRARGAGLDSQLTAALEKPKKQQSASQKKQLSERIARNREELQQVAMGLKLTHRSIFQALVITPQNLVDRRRELPPGAVVAEYFVTDDMLYIFVVSAGSSEPAVLQVPVSANDLNTKISEFREAIISEPEEIEVLGRLLNTWLLEPLRPHLTNSKTLIVMPFGPLYYVPFDALVTSDKGKPLRYAVEDLRISVQTSDTLEKLLAKSTKAKSGTMLAISNPDGSLPGAHREIKRIVKAAMPDAKVLTRKKATVRSFQDMAGAFRYLHLATHGVLSSDASKTHLTMSDGPLSVLQIAGLKGLKQNNDLVVLSACNTAMEKSHTTGDALVSLASGFSLAGSPTLLASLWEVPDSSTPELMATFYRALENGTGDKLDALRTAKLNLLRTQRGSRRPFASPWHWASFQLYGDFRTSGLASAPN